MNHTGSAGLPDTVLLPAEAREWLSRPSAARIATVWQDGARNAYPAAPRYLADMPTTDGRRLP
ncbi:hypothetical protein ACWGIU_00460 [Streptomyces sp. NPDC054840]